MKHFLPILFILFLLSTSFIDQEDPIYRGMGGNMKEINAEFTLPENFKSLDAGRRWPCGDWNHTNAMLYTIVNSDSSVRIGFSVIGRLTDRTNERIKKRNPDYDPNNNVIVTAKDNADTINNELIMYKPSYLEKFNADQGGEYVRNCTLPYEDIYPYNKVVFISKDGRGHVEISYFYKEEMKEEIDSLIHETAGIVRYND